MDSLQKLNAPYFMKWLFFLCRESNFTLSKSHVYVNGAFFRLQHFRLYTSQRVANSKNRGNLGELAKKSIWVRKEAQVALLDYFHLTRNIKYLDAENMSKNTPEYFEELLKRVEIKDDADVRRSLNRFLNYHPINEFEPFFESIGLRPSEYSSFVPRGLMFLRDDKVFLENYYVLCNYGIARNMIGNIYREAREVFMYDHGVLKSKLQSLEDLGFHKSFIKQIVTASPYLLKGEVIPEFLEAFGKLKEIGIGDDWLNEHLSGGDIYNWKSILCFNSLLSVVDARKEKLGEMVKTHPEMLLERSGGYFFHLFGLLLKFGFRQTDIQAVFLQFPEMSLVKFTYNLYMSYEFFVEVEMDVQNIGMVMRSFPILLGSCELKTVSSLQHLLNCGKGQVRQMVIDDPNVLKNWVRGVKVHRLPEVVSIELKSFLLALGFVENSKEMEKALKFIRGNPAKYQERFDCLVSTGLSREEAIKMVKSLPAILTQSKDVIKAKINGFASMGYPVSALVNYPQFFSYTTERLKRRLVAYNWLREEGVVCPNLGFRSVLFSSDKSFFRKYINSHPKGLEFWERLKNEGPA